MVVVGATITSAARKCLVHSIWPIASSMATSSASVELFVSIFYMMWSKSPLFLESLLYHFGCACQDELHRNYLPTTAPYHLAWLSESFFVHCNYCITLVRFLKSSLLGACTLVHLKTTAVCMSCLVQLIGIVAWLLDGEISGQLPWAIFLLHDLHWTDFGSLSSCIWFISVGSSANILSMYSYKQLLPCLLMYNLMSSPCILALYHVQ